MAIFDLAIILYQMFFLMQLSPFILPWDRHEEYICLQPSWLGCDVEVLPYRAYIRWSTVKELLLQIGAVHL